MFFIFRLFQVTFVLVVKLSGIWAFSEGPPLSTCEEMFAYHKIRGVVPRTYNQAQTGESPYNVTVSNSSYSAGENVTVTISGTITFNGYILQAQGTNSLVAWPVGEFVGIPSGTYSSLSLPAIERDKLRTWLVTQFVIMEVLFHILFLASVPILTSQLNFSDFLAPEQGPLFFNK